MPNLWIRGNPESHLPDQRHNADELEARNCGVRPEPPGQRSSEIKCSVLFALGAEQLLGSQRINCGNIAHFSQINILIRPVRN
jgi:hypothetical protein